MEQMLEESLELLESETFVDIDEVFVLDRHSMILHVLDDLSVNSCTSVDHDLELEAILVSFVHIEVFEEAEHEA